MKPCRVMSMPPYSANFGLRAHLDDRIAARRAKEEEVHRDRQRPGRSSAPSSAARSRRSRAGMRTARIGGVSDQPAWALEDVDREIRGEQHRHVVRTGWSRPPRWHCSGRGRTPGWRPRQAPAQAANTIADKHVDDRRQGKEKPTQAAAKPPMKSWPFDADVEHAATQRDAGRNAADEDGRRLQQRAGDAVMVAESSAQAASSEREPGSRRSAG